MNIELYGFGALVVIIIGQYFFQRYTAKERDEAEAALKAAEVLGLNQDKIAIDKDKKSAIIKEQLDEEAEDTINRITADGLSDLSTIDGAVSEPSGGRECARRIKELEIERDILQAKLDIIKKWYDANK